MKKINLFKSLLAATIIGIVLFLAGCYEFDFVIQPTSAEKNSSFEVQVSITTDSDAEYGEYLPYFGVKLPVGWTVQDSIPFFYDYFIWPDTGFFVYSDSLVLEMNILDPPEDGYYWWVAEGLYYVPYSPDLTFLINPVITTDSSSGDFFLDYMAGDNGETEMGTGLNRKRSDSHYIGVDLLEQVTVTNCNDEGPGSLREALNIVEFNGAIIFDIDNADTIILTSELEIYKNINLNGPEEDRIRISGQNQTRIFNVFNSCTAEISNLDLIDGLTDSNGGAILFKQSTLKLYDVAISNCTANEGGGLRGEFSEFDFDNLIISGCNAVKGGGVSLLFSSPTGKNLTISGCIAHIGGGIYLENTDFSLQNALLNENSATSHGGAVFCEDSEPAFRSVTIANNMAMYAGGLYHSRGISSNDFLIENSIISGNAPQNICLGTQSLNDPPSITFYYSDLEGGQEEIVGIGDINWMEGNISEEPLFEGSGDHPFQLSAFSPCIDAGNPDTTGMNLPFWDLMGNYRLWDGDFDGDTIVDMGAYEYGSVGVTTPEFKIQNSKFKISCYPNPFSEIVHLEFEIRNPSPGSIQIFNAIGERVAVLRDGIIMAGKQQVIWNAEGLPSGLYFCRVKAGGEVAVKKVLKP